MGVLYTLVNKSKKEIIDYCHMQGAKKRELAGDPSTAAVTTWYPLNNKNDDIFFITDDEINNKCSFSEIKDFKDVTEQTVKELIDAEILKDDGFSYRDDDEPATVYIKKYTNVWHNKT